MRNKIRLPFRISSIAAVVICLTAASWPDAVNAYKLSAQGTSFERSLAKTTANKIQKALIWAASMAVQRKVFGEAVHEEIAQRIFGCEGDAAICGNPDAGFATPYVVTGVRWNDDPPFQLQAGEATNFDCTVSQTIRFTTQPLCWYQLFRDAEQKASQGKVINASTKSPLLARSHFGDLQFFHAMASQDGETAGDTQQRVLMWAEFTWKVAIGEFKLDKNLKDVAIGGFDSFFGKSGWSVQELFALGNIPLRTHIKEVAFGSFLHTVMDSFAKGHVDRADATGNKCGSAPDLVAPGAIREFHSYVNQDSTKHGDADHRLAFAAQWAGERPNVVGVGTIFRGYWENGTSWDIVKPYVECVFAVEDPKTPATAGAGFAKDT